MNTRTNHEIDFQILGEEMQCVEIELDPQETVIAESGSFLQMDNEIEKWYFTEYDQDFFDFFIDFRCNCNQ